MTCGLVWPRPVRRRSRLAALLACTACTTSVADSGRVAQQAGIIAFSDVTVVDVRTGAARSGQDVLVTGERITAVAPAGSLRIPAGARLVEGAGRYLIPGLWDMHVHLGSTGRASLQVHVANGITGVRDMGMAFRRVQAWRDSIRSGQLLGPRVLLAGPIIESAAWLESVRREAIARGDSTPAGLYEDRIAVATPADAARAVDSIASLGADFIKLRTTPPPDALAELLRVARERRLPVAAHVPLPVSPERLAALEFASMEHGFVGVTDGRITSALDAVTDSMRRHVFRALAARGVAYTPTLIAARASRLTPDSVIRAVALDRAGITDARRRYVEPALAENWLRDLAARGNEVAVDWSALYWSWARDLPAAQEEGMLLLAGSDPGTPLIYPGFSLHDELIALVEDAGLSPAAALRAATINPARFMGADRSLGAVEPGLLADLVLLDANPLTDIRNTSRIRAVVLNGRYFDRAALDRLLDDARASVAALR